MCWQRDNCSRPICLFNHPSQTDCPEGELCFDPFCKLNHVTIMCKFEDKCKNRKEGNDVCKYRHRPETTNPDIVLSSELPSSKNSSKVSKGNSTQNARTKSILSSYLRVRKQGLMRLLLEFESRGKQKGNSDSDLKFRLPYAMKGRVAQNWFQKNQRLILDKSIDWATFRDTFISKCLREEEEAANGVWDILQSKPQPGEKASTFIQKIRNEIGDRYSPFGEDILISWMIGQLVSGIRGYLYRKGIPKTIAELAVQIQHYEETCFDSKNNPTAGGLGFNPKDNNEPEGSSGQPAMSTAETTNPEQVESSINIDELNIFHFGNTQVKDRNLPECSHCTERGHVKANCPNRQYYPVNFYVNWYENMK